ELPDILLYQQALANRIVGERPERVRIASPFLLRTSDPPVTDLAGRRVQEIRRLGKRIVFGFDSDYVAVLHPMIAGRLHWTPPGSLHCASPRSSPRKRRTGCFRPRSGPSSSGSSGCGSRPGTASPRR